MSAELLDTHGAGEAGALINAALAGKLERPVEVTRLVPILAGTTEQKRL